MESKIIDNALKDIQRLRDATKEIAGSSPDVKSGKVTIEDELQEPAYLLYQDILNSTAAFFESEPVKALCYSLGQSIGEKTTADIMTLVSVGMAHSAHSAILAYDDRIKAELSRQFDMLIGACNSNTADIQSVMGAIQIFRVQINKLTGREVIGDLFKGQNIKPEHE